MHESDILLKAIMDGGKHSIIVTDRHGIVSFMNQAAERLYGHEAASFVGQPISVLRGEIYERDDLDKEAEEMSREAGQQVGHEDVFRVALERRYIYERERTAIRRDGTRLHVLVTITAMRDDTGNLVGYLSVSQDISERKRLERMKSEFISTVSHELRTPLTSIRGALGLMVGGAAGKLPASAADLAALAYRNSERLVRIINDILDMEKVESGKFVFDIRAFDAVELVRHSLEENRAYAERHGVTFVMKDAPPSLTVLADPDRVLQVLANLLSNAAKFSPRGGEVWITVDVHGESARVSVRDFGQGIPEDFRDRVFDKFAQSENANAHRNEGTGLGLSIAQKMVEAMGGAIGFETGNEKGMGNGTTFTFSVPLAVELKSARKSDKMSIGTAFPVDSAQAALRKGRDERDDSGRILICEDDHDVASLLKLLLERAGFPADVAHTLAETRRLLRKHPYAALTLDLVMPDGDGLELLSELRADPAWKDLPVVVVSAKADEGRREHGDNNGEGAVELVDWVSKPINEDTLVQSLQRATRTLHSENPRILHVEDNEDLRKVLGDLFRGHADLIGASTLQEARALLKREPFDLIVLDIGLPDGSGLELMEDFDTLSGRPVPVLILSASEPADADLRKRVSAVLLKSRVSEERVVQTVLSLLREKAKSSTISY